MSVTKLLKEVGRPVAYYPKLALMLDSVNAAVFLCQFLYWSDKGSDPEGWIYKTQPEIEEETGLGRRKQESVRKKLRELGLLEEMRRGVHGTLHFRIDTEALDGLWSEWLISSMDENAIDQKRQSQEAPNANVTNRHSLNKDTETTSETTVDTPRASLLPDWLEPKDWARWVSHLTQKGIRLTVEQMKGQIEKLDKFRARGMPPKEVIEQAITSGWQGFYPLKKDANGNGSTTQPRRGRATYNERTNDAIGEIFNLHPS